ncbi:MAG: ribbon-helix-helix domain-containing protein [Candidatus Rokubacteria bacterium]|nr:ribbon-helix-helix domain-containing protein [Candidatus Rokubacteria bacterium]
MRTTIRLDDDLLRQTKALAARTGRTLTAVIEDALREALARQRSRSNRPRAALPTFSGNGLQRGVDLDDTAGLLDIMNGSRDPA